MPFKPGEGGGKAGRKSPQPSQLLKDMRWVYENPKGLDDELTPGRKLCRELYAESKDKFVTRLERMEKELRAGGKVDQGAGRSEAGGVSEGAAPPLDTGSRRQAEALEHWISARSGSPPPG